MLIYSNDIQIILILNTVVGQSPDDFSSSTEKIDLK